MSWLTQYFLNPGFVLPGAALVSVPIIIHLLSRLRYKKVKFAAMEFLLQSDELNRRRLIIEQLLLLLLRTLAVLLVLLLIARLVLDPSRMMLLRGATTHHVLVIDDTLSMRENVDNQTVFDQAIGTMEQLLTQAGSNTSSLQCTVLTMTQPDRPLVTDRALNNALVQELNPRLRNLTCSWKSASPVESLDAAYNMLSGDGGISPQVHVFTDLRSSDWTGEPEVAEAFQRLESIDARINVVQLTKQSTSNVAISGMTSRTLATAVGVPWRLDLTFRNLSPQKVTGLRATVYIDGSSLPVKVLVPDIEAGKEIRHAHDIAFESPGQHEVEVRLEQDALLEDNSRFVVVDVTDKRTVLIVDDDARQEDASYVASALGADQLAVEIRQSDVLVTEVLDNYDYIYLLNVRELPADATELVSRYVADGGGIAWFPDDQANTVWYSTVLRTEKTPLFPVALGVVDSIPEVAADDEPQFQKPLFESHPVFDFYADTPFADDIQISSWYQTVKAADDSTPVWPTDVRVLARLTNGSPVIFEHSHGDGKVLTFLTSAGRRWSNWPVLPPAPGFVVMHLLMHQYLQKPSRAVELRELGDPVRFEWPVGEYSESVEVFLPASEDDAANDFMQLTAAPVLDSQSSSADLQRLAVTIPQADRPGVYRIKRYRLEGEGRQTWLALSVPTTESDLTVAEASAIEGMSDSGRIRVIAADVATELGSSDSGRELRWLIIALLLIVLIAEQLMSLRMSFHPEVKS